MDVTTTTRVLMKITQALAEKLETSDTFGEAFAILSGITVLVQSLPSVRIGARCWLACALGVLGDRLSP